MPICYFVWMNLNPMEFNLLVCLQVVQDTAPIWSSLACVVDFEFEQVLSLLLTVRGCNQLDFIVHVSNLLNACQRAISATWLALCLSSASCGFLGKR